MSRYITLFLEINFFNVVLFVQMQHNLVNWHLQTVGYVFIFIWQHLMLKTCCPQDISDMR